MYIYDSITVILRLRSVSDRICRENQNTHYVFSNFFFPKKFCHLWSNVEKCGGTRQATGDSITWSRKMQIACTLSKATTAFSEYAMHIAFPWEQWLWECVTVFHYIYFACLAIHS